jgi:energy-coupling factor transporter ATP-binding protein EcfA2
MMESLDQLKSTTEEMPSPTLTTDAEEAKDADAEAQKSDGEAMARSMPTQKREIAAQALRTLWFEFQLEGEPLIFPSPIGGRMQIEHHPLLLNRLVEVDREQEKPRPGQLRNWRRLPPPEYAPGIAAVGEVNTLMKADLVQQAEIGDSGTIPAAPYSWVYYIFEGGWKALSVYFETDGNETATLAIIPMGRQDDWLAFLKHLDDLHKSYWIKDHYGRIEIIGGDSDLVDSIKAASYDDLVLPEGTLLQIKAQRHIFDKAVLNRYEALHMPRLRKVLLFGPSGTGKTTLLKAEGAYHAKQDGLVLYVSSTPPGRNGSPWQNLAQALNVAAKCGLPTVILIEDFEAFIVNPPDLQQVLNMLDGVGTPDNPAGTLLLATTNDPEKIDQRIRDRAGRIDVLIEMGLVENSELAVRFLKHFLGDYFNEEEHTPVASQLLKQPGSHFREVCISGLMHALEMGRSDVLKEDLLWAHDMIITGRDLASEAERFSPSVARKRGSYFGKNA